MANHSYDYDPMGRRVRSLVVSFRPPAGRHVSANTMCDQHGTVIDLIVSGSRCFCNESPMVVQPDLLVQPSTKSAVGLTFELTSPEWMLPLCKQMVKGLDRKAIRISHLDSANGTIAQDRFSLDILWRNTRAYERQFAQLDYGVWAFLYKSSSPSLFRDKSHWTPPEALVIGDLEQIDSAFDLADDDFGEITIEPVANSSL